MENLACPMPSGKGDANSAAARMLRGRRIAIVGLSDDPSRPSHGVAAYLRAAGKDIVPVNPNCKSVMGLKSYPALEDVPGPIDVVNVFRQAEHCPRIAQSAVAIGAKGVWLQSGVVSAEAERIARAAGIDFVQDRCMKVEHMFRDR